jgi:hypothetical protein
VSQEATKNREWILPPLDIMVLLIQVALVITCDNEADDTTAAAGCQAKRERQSAAESTGSAQT